MTIPALCDILNTKTLGGFVLGRKKNLNIVVRYGDTGIVINDLGPDKSPRFELYDLTNKISIKKSNNPYDFDKIMLKKWREK